MKQLLRKTAVRVNIRVSRSPVFKWVAKIYIFITAILGLLFVLYNIYGYNFKNIIPQDIPVPLGNGFIFAVNPKHGRSDRVILNTEGKLIIDGSMREIGIEGNIIYGRRVPVLSDESLFFICTYGEDCSKSQNYNKEKFTALLKEKGLPEFTVWGTNGRTGLITKEWLKLKLTFSDPIKVPIYKKDGRKNYE